MPTTANYSRVTPIAPPTRAARHLQPTYCHAFRMEDALYIGDPAYGAQFIDSEPPRARILLAREGGWQGFVATTGGPGGRVVSLYACHENFSRAMLDAGEVEFSLPVRSGCMAILNARAGGDELYQQALRAFRGTETFAASGVGVAAGCGAIGEYPVCVARDAGGRVLLLRVDFCA